MRYGNVGEVVQRIRKPRAWLGSIAMIDLLRALPDPAALPDWLLAFASVSAGTFLPRISTPVTWLLFAGGLYIFAPRFYPDRMGLPDQAPGFRLLVAGISLAVALLLAGGSGTEDLPWVLGIGGFIVLAGTVGLLTYLYVVWDWRLVDSQDPPVQPVASLTYEGREAVKAEITTDLQRDGVLGVLGTLVWLLGLGIIVVLPCCLAGLVANVLYIAYPLPELLVLGWVALGVISWAVPGFRVPTVDSFDLENRFYGTVRHVTRTTKGMFTAIFAGVGLFGGALYVLISVRVVAGLWTTPELLFAPVKAVAILAVSVPPLVAGIYLFWYWLRQFRRLRPFLEWWVGEESTPVGPARPPGLTGPPTLVVVVYVTLLGGPTDHALVLLTVVIVMLALLAGLTGCVYLTLQRSSTAVGREDLAVTAGLVVQSIGFFLASSGEQLWMAVVQRRFPPVLLDARLLVVVTLLVVLTVWPDVERYHESVEGWKRYVRSAFLYGNGFLFGGIATLFSGGLRLGLFLIAAMAFAGGGALTMTTYYEL